MRSKTVAATTRQNYDTHHAINISSYKYNCRTTVKPFASIFVGVRLLGPMPRRRYASIGPHRSNASIGPHRSNASIGPHRSNASIGPHRSNTRRLDTTTGAVCSWSCQLSHVLGANTTLHRHYFWANSTCVSAVATFRPTLVFVTADWMAWAGDGGDRTAGATWRRRCMVGAAAHVCLQTGKLESGDTTIAASVGGYFGNCCRRQFKSYF